MRCGWKKPPKKKRILPYPHSNPQSSTPLNPLPAGGYSVCTVGGTFTITMRKQAVCTCVSICVIMRGNFTTTDEHVGEPNIIKIKIKIKIKYSNFRSLILVVLYAPYIARKHPGHGIGAREAHGLHDRRFVGPIWHVDGSVSIDFDMADHTMHGPFSFF